MDIVLRATFIFFVILFVTRVVGRRELSSLEPFDLILLIVIGDLVQQAVTQNDFSVTGALLAVGTFALLTVAVSYATFRFRFLRPVLEGDPIIVLRGGEPNDRNLRRNRITHEELAAAARGENLASLEEAEWAVLETSGKITFIPKQQ